MIKKLIALFAGLFLVGCSKTGFKDVLKIEWPHKYKYYPSTGNKGRIYMTYGFGASNVQAYEQEPFGQWLQTMIDSGFSVVVYSQPEQKRENFIDGGYKWANAFRSYIPKLIQEIDQKYGMTSKNIAGGVSFGGLHALMAASYFPMLFNAFFALKPVTEFNQLTELKDISTNGFTPFNYITALRNFRGYITFDMSDDRVNGSMTRLLMNNFCFTHIYAREFFNSGHSSTEENLMPSVDWINSL